VNQLPEELYRRIDEIIESLTGEVVSSAQDIVQLKSVKAPSRPGMPFGEGVDACYRHALALSQQLGFSTVDVDGYGGHAETGHGEEIVGILGHLDVMPEGVGWTYPPYGAEIHDGVIYGRGIADDKGAIIASMYAIVALQRAGVSFSKRVRVIFGLDEESGMASVRAYLAREEEPDVAFTPDGAFPAIHGEKGIFTFRLRRSNTDGERHGEGLEIVSIQGGRRSNVVPDFCEARIRDRDGIFDELSRAVERADDDLTVARGDDGCVVVKAFGVPAHGASPAAGINAISKLLLFLNTQPIASRSLAEVIDFYCRAIGSESDGQSLGCGLKDEESGALTLNVGVIEVDGEMIDILCNIRYPVTATLAEVSDPITTAAEAAGLELVYLSHQDPLYIPQESLLVRSLMKAYQDVTGDYETAPMVIGGGTYAKAVRNCIAFGPGFPGVPSNGHQADERMRVDHLVACTRIYARAIYELLQ